MSQSRKKFKISRRESSDRDIENSSECLLPETLEQADKKIKIRRSVQEVTRVSTRVKIKTVKLREAERDDSSSNINDESESKKNKENVKYTELSVGETDGQPLVLDDLIDDFCDEELEHSGEVTDSERGNSDASAPLVLELVEDSFESEIDEEPSFEEHFQWNKCYKEFPKNLIKSVDHCEATICEIWKYGKLWEFIRDLLKIKKYNPSAIRWENVEEGEFRIVDSVMVAHLWATVKENKRMNYEKLSRAMRYYYKYKIFQIVPDKRLVYKFGPRATGWKPRTGQTGVNPGEEDPVWADRTNLRCSKCLCNLESGPAAQDHLQTCTHEIVLPEVKSKKNGETLRSRMLSRTTRRTLREINSKREVLTVTQSDHNYGSMTKADSQSPELEITEQSDGSWISNFQTKKSPEHLALECLMSLGIERTSEQTKPGIQIDNNVV